MSSKPAADTRSPDGRSDAVLSRALDRARSAILWERLWPALAAPATAVGLFLAVSWLGVWLCMLVLPACRRRHPAAASAALPDPRGCVAAPRWQVRPAASAGHHHCGRYGGQHHRPVLDRALARPYRARLAGSQAAQGRSSDAASCPARSLRAARPRPGARDRDLCGGGRRAHAAHLCGVRLAGRDGAGQFPRRRLGEPADLYGQAPGDLGRPAAGRGDADRIQPVGTRFVGAGRQHARHPRHRRCPSRRRRDRRPRRSENRRAGRSEVCRAEQCRERHRGAPLHHQRCGQRHRPRRRRQ